MPAGHAARRLMAPAPFVHSAAWPKATPSRERVARRDLRRKQRAVMRLLRAALRDPTRYASRVEAHLPADAHAWDEAVAR